MPNPYIHPISRQEAQKRINVLCWYFPALLDEKCGERRLAKAAYLATSFVGEYVPPFQYYVESQTGSGQSYVVDVEERSCECPDNAHGFICKHRLAVACFTHAPQLIAQLEKNNPLDADAVFRGLFVECNLDLALA